MKAERLKGDTMKRRFFRAFFPVLFFTLVLAASCDWDTSGTDGIKYIEYEIAASTWERTEPAFWPEGKTTTAQKGTLVFTYNSVKISGPIAHLQGFTRDTALEAYTEDNNLYIKDKGVWQSPIQYTRWHSGGSYPYDKMLTLKGGVPDETLKRTGD
jgi:hypothetical protein